MSHVKYKDIINRQEKIRGGHGKMREWTMRVRSWSTIIGQLSIHFDERIEACL